MQIDQEFKNLIPPLLQEEYSGLEASILAEGCRDSLVTWNGILIDGHNRYEICTKHGIQYNTVTRDFASRDAVADWIDSNQLGRRNLTPDQMSLLRGRRYNRMKKAAHRPEKGDQNDPVNPQKTADILSKQHGVSPATIKRDGAAAELLEKHPEQAAAIIRGDVKKSDVIRELKREEVVAKLEDIAVREVKAVQGVYDVIVLDPPWPMEKIERDVTPNQVAFEYPTMTEQDMADLKIPAADDCHVFVWTTHKFLPMALRLVSAWGFKYVLTMVWHKPGGFQPFGLPQYNCEFAIYARKGKPQFVDTKAFPVCFSAPRAAHSAKPEEFYELLRRVTAGRRLDMFNRRDIKGFDIWGNESGN
jgi:N6-adenosine-specific RNA methylase IME4